MTQIVESYRDTYCLQFSSCGTYVTSTIITFLSHNKSTNKCRSHWRYVSVLARRRGYIVLIVYLQQQQQQQQRVLVKGATEVTKRKQPSRTWDMINDTAAVVAVVAAASSSSISIDRLACSAGFRQVSLNKRNTTPSINIRHFVHINMK